MSMLTHKYPVANFKALLGLLFLFFALTEAALAQQDGASSAAAARTRYLSELGSLPASREVAVEEFVNYHRHQIGNYQNTTALPSSGRYGYQTNVDDCPKVPE